VCIIHVCMQVSVCLPLRVREGVYVCVFVSERESKCKHTHQNISVILPLNSADIILEWTPQEKF
jgi:hypothetical protein